METGGGRLSEREEDVTHDGGAADARGGDDVKYPVHVLSQVFLRSRGVS